MALKYVQALTQYLAGGGVVIGATNAVLASFTDIYGNAISSMTPFGTKGYITFEPDTTNEEGATFTSVTANANGTVTLGGLSTILAQSPYTETSGLLRSHSGGTKLVVTDNVAFWNTFANKNNDETVTGQWTFNNFPITPSNSNASTTVAGVTKLSVAPVSPTNPIAVGVNDTTTFAAITSVPAGVMFPYAAAAAPTGFLLCDGSAVSRATYAALFAVISTSWGVGDGSTTFNLPDTRGRTMIGTGTGTKVATATSVAGNILTVTGLTNAAGNEFQTGQPAVFTATVAGNLVTLTTYYIIRVTNTTFSVATSLANAQAGTAIVLAGTERGTFTITLTARTLADTGGEETHAMSSTELLAHSHTVTVDNAAGTTGHVMSSTGAGAGNTALTAISTTGGNTAMNDMQPFFVGAWIIKT